MSIAFVVVGLLLAGTGLAAGAAATAIRRVDLYRWAARGDREARAAEPLLDAPERALRVANALGVVGMLLAGAGIVPWVAGLPGPLAAAVTALGIVPVFLVAGHAVPRALGRFRPEAVMERSMGWLRRLAPLLAPVRAGSATGAGAAQGRLGPHVRDDDDAEALDRDDLTALAGVLGFTERPVREVMTPRTDVVAVPADAPVEEVGRTFATAGYSRLPVFRESLDDINGMVYVFDLLKAPSGGALPVRPVTTAPASKRCGDLLFEMQRDRRHMAVVLDEYGGTAGLLTLEDLLEELVGEIFDEYDAAAGGEGDDHGVLEVTGATPVVEVAGRFEVSLPEEAETLGGLLTRAAGRIPRAGERYLLCGLEFDVLEATPNRLVRVVVRRATLRAVSLDRGGDR